MYSPTSRLLTILELLQSRGVIRGVELAERLEVDVRTVRRYIMALNDLGVPIDAARGRNGSYRLRPGFKLPPLLFTDDEALALTVGLLAARRLGRAASAPAIEGSLAKIERVLPDTVRQRIQAVADTLLLDVRSAHKPTQIDTIATLSVAVQEHCRVRLEHRKDDHAIATTRMIDPYGLVYRAGHTYLVGHCHLRDSIRVFRLDRVEAIIVLDVDFEPPVSFDPVEHVVAALASAPRRWSVEVLLETDMATARTRIPVGAALLSETTDGVVVRCNTDDLDWFACVLLGLRCPFIIREPPALRNAVRAVAIKATHLAERVA